MLKQGSTFILVRNKFAGGRDTKLKIATKKQNLNHIREEKNCVVCMSLTPFRMIGGRNEV